MKEAKAIEEAEAIAKKVEEENRMKEIKREKISEEEDDLAQAAALQDLEDRAAAMRQKIESKKRKENPTPPCGCRGVRVKREPADDAVTPLL